MHTVCVCVYTYPLKLRSSFLYLMSVWYKNCNFTWGFYLVSFMLFFIYFYLSSYLFINMVSFLFFFFCFLYKILTFTFTTTNHVTTYRCIVLYIQTLQLQVCMYIYIYIFIFICMYVYRNRIYACIWYIFTTFEQTALNSSSSSWLGVLYSSLVCILCRHTYTHI